METSIFAIPLVREISVILLIKLALIIAIKMAFFSQPVDLQQPQHSLIQHLGLAPSQTQPSHQSSTEERP